jgi:cGMP-dependent protein kinase
LDFKKSTKLVNFRCCAKASRSYTLVGTQKYLAPEVILEKGYTCSIDWWSLRVMVFELIFGPLPFGSDTEDQLELFKEIMEALLHFPKYVVDETAISVLSAFLERQPELRFGSSVRTRARRSRITLSSRPSPGTLLRGNTWRRRGSRTRSPS